MKKIQVVYTCLFALMGFAHLLLVMAISNYLFASTGDMHNYAFDQTWSRGLVSNFTSNTGRWGQGISNDYRFYEYKQYVIPLINVLFLFALYSIFKRLLPKTKAFILTVLFYFTVSVCSFSYYYLFYYLPVANSYSIAFSLSLLLYSCLFLLLNDSTSVSRKNLLMVLCIVAIIAISGLVEVVSIPVPYVLGALLVYLLLFQKKLSLRILLLFIISAIGFLVLYFSPGNTRRRGLVDTEESFTLFNIDYGLLFEQAGNVLERQTGIMICFLIVAIYFVIRFSKKKIRFSPLQKLYISLAVLGFVFLPMLIGFLASNGTIGMAKVYNFFTLHLLMGGIALFHVYLQPINASRKKYLPYIDVFVFSFAVVFFGSLFFKKNHLGNTLSGYMDNRIQGLYVEEQSRRHLLISNKDSKKEQNIPNFAETNRQQVFNIRPFKDQYMPKSYGRIFNQGQKVFSKESTVTPNALYGAFLVSKENAKANHEWAQGERAYFIGGHNVLVLQGFESNCEIKIRTDYKTPLKSKTTHIVFKAEDFMVDGSEFDLPIQEGLVALDIPYNTKTVRVFACGRDFVDITVKSEINETQVRAFEDQTRFSIMN